MYCMFVNSLKNPECRSLVRGGTFRLQPYSSFWCRCSQPTLTTTEIWCADLHIHILTSWHGSTLCNSSGWIVCLLVWHHARLLLLNFTLTILSNRESPGCGRPWMFKGLRCIDVECSYCFSSQINKRWRIWHRGKRTKWKGLLIWPLR